ncbi:type II secretion system F family protein [Raoultibacter phocaeensis]|uniref:type II secretion system F family protein n=1 Tax=Raoultibacter phocaeensis TaxID=2479841 RepID=UPI00111A7B93|nr:type II secretion system F family protein [Raoultibacter phocaeensis]
MPTFTYKGITAGGMPANGVVEAFDEIEAMELARAQCRVVQEVKRVRARTNLLAINITKPKAKLKNLAIMCSQFSIILNAGLPIGRAVALVADQTTDKYLKSVLADVSSDVAAGHSLADSLENKGDTLPTMFIETIRSGEESGHLPEAFARLHTYFDKRSKIAAKVASALTYPIFVVIIAVVVVAVMMVAVIPAMTGMISSLGTDMPWITQLLIDSSDWLQANILWVVLVIALVLAALKLYGRSDSGKSVFALMKLKAPIVGVISVYSGAAEFANSMATLIAAGLPMTRAVQVTSRVLENYLLSRETGAMLAGLTEGKSLGECMEETNYFPRTLIEMATVGEQTGELEETLQTIGEFYDSETQRVTDRALSLLEPALLVLMALFAGGIVVALYLPMFQLYASM